MLNLIELFSEMIVYSSFVLLLCYSVYGLCCCLLWMCLWCKCGDVLQKADSLSKLYEMDDSPDRRHWLDKLLQFMEDRGSPITACPTISKNPLDLFRLYLYVKERGGFMEVCKVQCSSMVVILPLFS